MVKMFMAPSLPERLRSSLAQGSIAAAILLAVAGCGTQPLGPGSLDGNWRITISSDGTDTGVACLTITDDRITSWLAGCSSPMLIEHVDPVTGEYLRAVYHGRGNVSIEVGIWGTEKYNVRLFGTVQGDGTIAGTMTVLGDGVDAAAFLMERR